MPYLTETEHSNLQNQLLRQEGVIKELLEACRKAVDIYAEYMVLRPTVTDPAFDLVQKNIHFISIAIAKATEEK